MNFFVDDHLLEMAEDEGTVEFFRRYMAGFVISKRESAISHCGALNDNSNNSISITDLMCSMLSVTPVVRNEPLFGDSIARQEEMDDNCFSRFIGLEQRPLTYESTVTCSVSNLNYMYNFLGPSQYPDCYNVTLHDTKLLLEQDNTTQFALIDNEFEVDGAVKQETESKRLGGIQPIGRMHAPYNTEMTGATIYYNNQVCNLL